MSDLSGQRILDLGCGAGNPLSVPLAEQRGSYLGIDLSENALDILSRKLSHVPTARVRAVDFLSDQFDEGPFDVVYAKSVFSPLSTPNTVPSQAFEPPFIRGDCRHPRSFVHITTCACCTDTASTISVGQRLGVSF